MAFVDIELRPAGEAQQKVGRIKLSEELRIGAKLRSQAYGCFFNGVSTCALGAIAEARGWTPTGTDSVYGFLSDLDSALREQIGRRNDNDRMSREKIADWLESQGL